MSVFVRAGKYAAENLILSFIALDRG